MKELRYGEQNQEALRIYMNTRDECVSLLDLDS